MAGQALAALCAKNLFHWTPHWHAKQRQAMQLRIMRHQLPQFEHGHFGSSQFIAKDFKEFIRISGMTHVRTSPFYPQSNGKIERWHKSLKGECIRPGTPLSLEDARRLVQGYVDHYNDVRLNNTTGYITPKDIPAGRQQEIHAERDRKLEAAGKMRNDRRQQAA